MLYPPASTVAICVVLPVLAIIAVLLRFYVRIRVQPTYVGIDDWLAVAACLFACADSANLIASKEFSANKGIDRSRLYQ